MPHVREMMLETISDNIRVAKYGRWKDPFSQRQALQMGDVEPEGPSS